MSTTESAADAARRTEPESASIGGLVGEIGADVSRLVRDEIDLAKAEVREETAKAGKAAAAFATAGFAGYMTALLLTVTAVLALDLVLNPIAAAGIVTGVWALIAVAGFLLGRRRIRGFSPLPRQTVETLKEDARWLRHPTSLDRTSN